MNYSVALSLLLIAHSATAAEAWRKIGDGIPFTPIGAQALIADPAAPTLYAIIEGLLFRSTDGSGSWTALSGVTQVNSLLIDPKDSATLYVGTDHGVLKSMDAGASWNGAAAGLPQDFVGLLAADPVNSLVLYARTATDIFKTSDGGKSWNALNSKFYAFKGAAARLALGQILVVNLIIDPADGSLYVGAFAAISTAFKSIDGGATWYGGAMVNGGFGALALDRATGTLYLSYSDSKGHIVKSTDQGGTWIPAETGFPDGLAVDFAIDPKNPGTLYARYVVNSADQGFAKSTDGGGSWTTISNGIPANYSFTSLAIDANSILYTGFSDGLNFGGIFKSADGGAVWRGANAGPVTVNLPALVAEPAHPDILYAATGANGVFKSSDRGASWTKSGAYQADQFGVWGASAVSLAVSADDPDLLYAWTGCVLFESTDGGAAWNSKASLQPFCSPLALLAIDPRDSNTLYFAQLSSIDGSSSLQKTTDGGTTWNYIWVSYDFYLGAVAIDPTTPTTIYLGTTNGLLKSTDGGANWAETAVKLGVSAIAVDPLRPNVVYAATGTNASYNLASGFAGLFKSIDGGATWNAVNAGLEILSDTGAAITALALDPVNSGIVYAGTAGNGVFRSGDGGAHWTPFNVGLTNFDIRMLAIASGRPELLYASTSGGLFAIASPSLRRGGKVR